MLKMLIINNSIIIIIIVILITFYYIKRIVPKMIKLKSSDVGYSQRSEPKWRCEALEEKREEGRKKFKQNQIFRLYNNP